MVRTEAPNMGFGLLAARYLLLPEADLLPEAAIRITRKLTRRALVDNMQIESLTQSPHRGRLIFLG